MRLRSLSGALLLCWHVGLCDMADVRLGVVCLLLAKGQRVWTCHEGDVRKTQKIRLKREMCVVLPYEFRIKGFYQNSVSTLATMHHFFKKTVHVKTDESNALETFDSIDVTGLLRLNEKRGGILISSSKARPMNNGVVWKQMIGRG